ncbi:MAG: hypothetical protein KC609_25125 [Myxococcales bacterium]|nr:hypothetical protein [Myxococcales bacterium]
MGNLRTIHPDRSRRQSGGASCPDDEALARFVDDHTIADARLVAHLVHCRRCREIVAVASGVESGLHEGVVPLRRSLLADRARLLFPARPDERLELCCAASGGDLILLRHTGEALASGSRRYGEMRRDAPNEVAISAVSKSFPLCRVEVEVGRGENGRADCWVSATMRTGESNDALRCSVWRGEREVQSAYFRDSRLRLKRLPLTRHILVLEWQRRFVGEVILDLGGGS